MNSNPNRTKHSDRYFDSSFSESTSVCRHFSQTLYVPMSYSHYQRAISCLSQECSTVKMEQSSPLSRCLLDSTKGVAFSYLAIVMILVCHLIHHFMPTHQQSLYLKVLTITAMPIKKLTFTSITITSIAMFTIIIARAQMSFTVIIIMTIISIKIIIFILTIMLVIAVVVATIISNIATTSIAFITAVIAVMLSLIITLVIAISRVIIVVRKAATVAILEACSACQIEN